ncbi:hypothetical protein F4859DRAFT_207669 [Xylaria cf. heliscus]|nr:hypothetical protein F4859DRAFT_207669 [Xylaria cf. heliscus]
MPPSTKIWLVTLNEGHSMIETAFAGIWTETLLAAASRTNDRDEHYALFQCNSEPDHLAIILGNCSIDASLEAQETGDGPLSRLMEFITHKELFHLDMDVNELPLEPGRISIAFSESQPADSDSLPGKGKWGLSTWWSRAEHNGDGASKPDRRMWIQVASSEDADQLRQVGDVKNFSKILESHVASE